tara:strand:+ start:545 stop:1552 length:1008 start_codon:yes stop_codon:yes gene_type:complete
MSSKKWLCKGPRGIQGQGIVGNNWNKCFNNHIPTIDSECSHKFNNEQQAKEFCYQSVANEINTNIDNFNPQQYSCVIKKNKTKCDGKYTSVFQKNPLQVNYHGGHSGNLQGMELYIMDIDKVYENYIETMKQKNEELSAKEQQQNLIRQLKQQDLEQQMKQKQERDEKRRLFRLQIENEIRSEMKDNIQQQLFGIDNEVMQSLKKEQQDLSEKRFQKLQNEIQQINKNIQGHQHSNISDDIKLNNDKLVNQKILEQKLVNEIKKVQLDKNEMFQLLIPPKEEPKSINQLLDDAEKFLLNLLSSSSIEPFSQKKCIWNYAPLIILIAIIVVLIIKH